jgi:hypothetical protein
VPQTYRHHYAFTKQWFASNRERLCRVFNLPVIGKWLRGKLGLRHDGKLIDITTDSLVIESSSGQREYTGWTGDVVSQFVYEIAKPLWWAIHYWDEWIADRWIPQWSYGFSTIITSPFFTQTASPTTRAFDAIIFANGTDFASVRNTPTGINPFEPATFEIYEAPPGSNPTNIEVSLDRYLDGTIKHRMSRAFLHFDIGIIAGARGEYRPGFITINTAHVIAVVTNPNTPQDRLAINQSTIPAERTSTTLQGPDFRQTPTTSATYFPFVGSELNLQSPSQFVAGDNPAIDPDTGLVLQLIPASDRRSQPDAYQWIFNDTGKTYIETSYYPPSFETFGSHTGLARFCVRQREDVTGVLDVTSSNTLFSKVNMFLSRDVVDGSVPSHAPRLTVKYTPAIVLDAESAGPSTQFGLPEIAAPRRIEAIGIAPRANRFGVLDWSRRELEYRARGIISTLRIGLPRIPVVFASGIAPRTTFGRPSLLRAIRPLGFSSTRIGNAIWFPGNGIPFQLVGLRSTPKIGEPYIEVRAPLEINPIGIGPLVKFGTRGYISDGFPDFIYASKLIDLPLEYQMVTFEYDGGRVDTNVQVCGMRRWRLEYEGLSESDLASLVDHFNFVQGRTGTFIFYHRRDEIRYTNCRYVSFDIPSRVKKWANNVSIVIERQE